MRGHGVTVVQQQVLGRGRGGAEFLPLGGFAVKIVVVVGRVLAVGQRGHIALVGQHRGLTCGVVRGQARGGLGACTATTDESGVAIASVVVVALLIVDVVVRMGRETRRG